MKRFQQNIYSKTCGINNRAMLSPMFKKIINLDELSSPLRIDISFCDCSVHPYIYPQVTVPQSYLTNIQFFNYIVQCAVAQWIPRLISRLLALRHMSEDRGELSPSQYRDDVLVVLAAHFTFFKILLLIIGHKEHYWSFTLCTETDFEHMTAK